MCVYDKIEVHTCKKYFKFELVSGVKRAKRTIHDMGNDGKQ